ncbi:hypothetical protein FRC09_000149 [Ceratobasidium sp. 395]|nr:hypothetical protein FRC09_000149 [Ceratobasidium sp. 395]
MDNLTEGPYQLRYIAPEEPGQPVDGLYAMRIDRVGDPITVGPRAPSLLEGENWWFEKTPDVRYWYILAQGPLPKLAGRGPVRLGFSTGAVKQGAPIVYATALGKYVIKLVGDNEYTIAPAPRNTAFELTGIDYVVSASSKGTLEIREVKAHVDGQPVVPKWSFHKVE